MAIRSHVTRSMDFSIQSNRLIAGLTGVSLVAGLVVWATGGPIEALWAPVYTFLVWAMTRELDPDHSATALVAGLAAGLWALAGLEVVGILAVGGFLLAARLVVNSTGRRPLVTDLIVLGIFATIISFTSAGWVAGFGVALAIYIDDRMADEPTTAGVLTAALAALGASGVATLSRVFPQQIPNIRPLLVVAVGVLALVAVIREPVTPTSLVDSRRKTPIQRNRLHGARSLTGVLLFGAAFLLGPEASEVGPLVLSLALALAANEAARLRRG